MKRLACLGMFVVCLGWIVCGILLTGDTGAGFRHWDVAAAFGALASALGVVD